MTAQLVKRSATIHLNGAPDVVFPLFTAVGEYKWIPGWQPELIYPPSGEPMTNNVFVTQHEGRAQTTWVTVDYDTEARHVEYVNITPDYQAVRIEIQCRAAADGGTDATVTHTLIALSEAGGAEVEKLQRSQSRRTRPPLGDGDQLLSGTRRADPGALKATRAVNMTTLACVESATYAILDFHDLVTRGLRSISS